MASRKSERILFNRWCEMGKKTATKEVQTVSSSGSEDSDHTPLAKQFKKSKATMEEGSEEVHAVTKEAGENTGKKKGTTSKKKATDKKKEVTEQENPTQTQKPKEKEKSKEKALVIAENPEATQKQSKKSEAGDKGKKPMSGKAKIPSFWFVNPTLKETWDNGFDENPISHCNWVEPALMSSFSFDYMEKFKASSLMSMINPSDMSYPRFTRLFYLNMSEVIGNNLAISSRVGSFDIVLNHAAFSRVLKCPRRYDTSNYPDKKDCLRMAREKFFIPGVQNTSRQLTHSVLTVEAKILFTVIMRCVVPRETSKELLTDKVLMLMYLIVEGYEIDLPSIVMEHMLSCCTKNRKHALPYANLLPLFFKDLKIPLSYELRLTHMSGIITESTLQRIGIVKTQEGVWKFYTELTASELEAKTFVKPKAQTLMIGSGSSKNDLLEEIGSLKAELEEIRESQFNIESNMRRMSFTVMQNNENILKIMHHMGLDGIETTPKDDTVISSESTRDLFGEHSEGESHGYKVVPIPQKGSSSQAVQDKEEQGKKKKRKVDEVTTEEQGQEMETEATATEEGKDAEKSAGDADMREASSEDDDEATP